MKCIAFIEGMVTNEKIIQLFLSVIGGKQNEKLYQLFSEPLIKRFTGTVQLGRTCSKDRR